MSKEIKAKIDALNEQLEIAMDPTTFVLNPAATMIFREIEQLQNKCQHSFVDKECEYCGRRKENV